MKSSYSTSSNKKIVFYAVIAAVILGVGAVMMQDIQPKSEHISQKISVNLNK